MNWQKEEYDPYDDPDFGLKGAKAQARDIGYRVDQVIRDLAGDVLEWHPKTPAEKAVFRIMVRRIWS